ncbi:MAG: HAMP domain-containing sensor histidine kinase, partial [Pseudomonadota bacterium]
LLDLSRLDSGTREFTPINVVIRAEIDAALVTLGSIADKKRISVRNRCPSEFEWVVDQRAFKQIVINLVNNAIKFSPPGSNVDISLSETENAMALRIRDEGPGVTPSDREKILTPFGRGEFAETHKIDGVGLGLTIVSELLKLQGGYIEIDSQPRIGSTFVAVFPKVAETANRAATA